MKHRVSSVQHAKNLAALKKLTQFDGDVYARTNVLFDTSDDCTYILLFKKGKFSVHPQPHPASFDTAEDVLSYLERTRRAFNKKEGISTHPVSVSQLKKKSTHSKHSQ